MPVPARRSRPSSRAPSSSDPAPAAGLELFSAEITAVSTEEELQAALAERARDIEIRAHLDLRNLELQPNPYAHAWLFDYDDARSNRTDLTFVAWPTRSIRGNCSDATSPFGSQAGTSFTEGFTSEPLPLKPFQCLLVTDTNTFHINTAHGIWFDNLYVAYTMPRRVARYTGEQHVHGTVLSTGARRFLNENGYNKPINIFWTNITVQGHVTTTVTSRVLSITPLHAKTSLLIEDSVFSNISGRQAPFLFSFGTYATFKNCLFRDVDLPRSELFDVSHFGTTSLLDCHFGNVSTGTDLADTSYNDLHQALLRYRETSLDEYIYDYYYFQDEHVTVGDIDHMGYDFSGTPAPAAAADHFGSVFMIRNQTISDCLAPALAVTNIVLPGCPPESVQARKRQMEGHQSLFVPSHIVRSGAYVYTYNIDYAIDNNRYEDSIAVSPQGHQSPLLLRYPNEGWTDDQDESDARDQCTKRENAFYQQYYDSVVPDNLADVWSGGSELSSSYAPGPWVSGEHPQHSPYAYGPCAYFAYDTYLSPGAAPMPASRYSGENLFHESAREKLETWTAHVYDEYVPLLGDRLSDQDSWFVAMVEELPGHPPTPEAAAAAFHNSWPLCTHYQCFHEEQRLSPASGTVAPDSQQTLYPWVALVAALSCTMLIICLAAAVFSFWRRHRRGVELGDGRSTLISLETDADSANAALNAGPAMNPQYEYKLPTGLALDNTDHAGLTNSCGPREQGLHSAGCSAKVCRVADTSSISPGGTHQVQTCSYRLSHTSLAVLNYTGRCHGDHSLTVLTSVATASALAPQMDFNTACTDAAGMNRSLQRVVRQLNRLSDNYLLLGRFQLLGPHHRRHGGQALVQFAVDPRDGKEFAVKFFLDEADFWAEAAVYAARNPCLRAHLSNGDSCSQSVPTECAHASCAHVGMESSEDCNGSDHTLSEAGARFLPQVEALCDNAQDSRGRSLPPCIIMEKGESLQDWSNRAEPDLFTSLSVLSNVALRLATMHEAGYVHRDLKPANVMWLPRENRWTVIDFGCVARIDEEAHLRFTLAYAPPEVVDAYDAGETTISARAAIDAWSFGVMAFELLTGAPVFNFLTEGTGQVVQRLKGILPLPWEEHSALRRRLGRFKYPVLELLQRDPSKRTSLRRFHSIVGHVFEASTTGGTE